MPPLTKRNSLVNQVKFLGLVHTFATVSPSNVQNFFPPNLLKNRTDTQVEITKSTVVREMLITDPAISLVLGNKPKKFYFVHQTISRHEVRTGWAKKVNLTMLALQFISSTTRKRSITQLLFL